MDLTKGFFVGYESGRLRNRIYAPKQKICTFVSRRVSLSGCSSFVPPQLRCCAGLLFNSETQNVIFYLVLRCHNQPSKELSIRYFGYYQKYFLSRRWIKARKESLLTLSLISTGKYWRD